VYVLILANELLAYLLTFITQQTDSLVNFLVDHPLLQVLRLVEPSGIDDVIAYPMEDDLLEAIGMYVLMFVYAHACVCC
jgi:hypothetical protein